MRLTNGEVGSGCLVLSLAGSFGLQWSLWPPSQTQEGIETRSNPNKAEAWQEVAWAGMVLHMLWAWAGLSAE